MSSPDVSKASNNDCNNTAAPPLRIGLVSISDRASAGVYRDEGIPALTEWLGRAIQAPSWQHETRLIPDEQAVIEATLCELVDKAGCQLVLTTGGTGPAPRDVTPEATLAVADREMPGFGEQMRQISLRFVPTAILSRQTAVIRKGALILNLPGQPKSIRETLEGLRDADGKVLVAGIFAAIPYCIDLIGGPYIETDDSVCKAFRPKSAQRLASSPNNKES
jgi:molybdopterin adenylyltransferase